MIGIYKIASPSGRVYIGQSTNIEKRFKWYKSLNNSIEQVRLHRSFKKYGVENHVFDVIIECNISELNENERYYQDLFNAIGKNGLNCRLTKSSDRSGKLSAETIQRKSDAVKREKNPMFGRKHTEEAKLSISNLNSGRIQTEEEKKKRADSRNKYFESNDGFWKGKIRGESPRAKKVINTTNNEIFECAKDAADSIQMNYGTLKCQLNGRRRNKTIFKYLE